MKIKEQLKHLEDSIPLPLPLPALPAVKAFDANMLPTAIKDYVLDVSDRQQSPPDFIAVTAICALAAVLGRKVQICPKQHDDWTVIPNQWGIIIGRPSAMKSPSMKEALRPLFQIEAEAAKQFNTANKRYLAEKTLSEMEKEFAKQKAKKMALKGNRNGAILALEETEFNETPPKRNRLVVNDVSVEKLGELLNENPNGLILVRDELAGWVAKLSKEEFQSDRAFYLECFDGNGRFIYDRIVRGTIEIENCTLSLIGGIQPSKIRQLLREAISGVSDDGLIQRLQMLVWPDDSGKWVWKDKEPNKQAYKQYCDAFLYLHGLNAESDLGTKCFRFTSEAQNLFIDWIEEIQSCARNDDMCSAFESHLLKMPKTIAGLALLIELIDGGSECGPRFVGSTSMLKAIRWAYYLQSHAERLYGSIKNEALESAHLILRRRNKLSHPFTFREIHRKAWTGLAGADGAKILNEALEYLIEYHHLKPVEVPSSSEAGGRPTTLYYWNEG